MKCLFGAQRKMIDIKEIESKEIKLLAESLNKQEKETKRLKDEIAKSTAKIA